MNHLSVRVFAVVLLMGSLECQAFQRAPLPAHQRRVSFREAATARTFGDEEKNQEKKHFLLEEFSTHAGEVINPYKILKVSREADRSEIRKAYIKLSKRYHPDGARHRDILPGKCNNVDDVREEWERIKLSYEILSDKKARKRFDRHELIADPGAAMRRAGVGVVGKGITSMGSGLFNLGAFAIKKMTGDEEKEK